MKFCIIPDDKYGPYIQNGKRVKVLDVSAGKFTSPFPVIESDSLDALKSNHGLSTLMEDKMARLAAIFGGLSAEGKAATIGLRRDILDANDVGHPDLIPLLVRKFPADGRELKTAQTQALALFNQ